MLPEEAVQSRRAERPEGANSYLLRHHIAKYHRPDP